MWLRNQAGDVQSGVCWKGPSDPRQTLLSVDFAWAIKTQFCLGSRDKHQALW